MAGNTWGWTSDWYNERYYRISPSKDPFGLVGRGYKVLRGDSWGYLPINLRVARREYHDPLGVVVVAFGVCRALRANGPARARSLFFLSRTRKALSLA